MRIFAVHGSFYKDRGKQGGFRRVREMSGMRPKAV